MRTKALSFLLPFIGALVLDQATKWWASRTLIHRSITVVEGLFELRLAFNIGSAFGLVLLNPLWLGVLTVAVSLFFLGLIPRVPQAGISYYAGTGLFLGGAWGNLLDRFRWGHVIDFLNPSFWPTFNVADVVIIAGLVLVFLNFWRLETTCEQRKDTGV
ncbi:MAG TPA: signal peptidase II [Atribacteraceae bacterium]|nr:signal peptidase II [Atribacteraceae bacterium]